MAMEIWRGKVTGLTQAGEGKAVECEVGSCHVILHRDLESSVSEGDEILVSGNKDEQGLKALAVNNLTKQRLADVDGSNYVLIMGMAGFVCLLCFVLGVQYMSIGRSDLGAINGLISLAGLAGTIIMVQRVLAIRRAHSWVKYSKE